MSAAFFANGPSAGTRSTRRLAEGEDNVDAAEKEVEVDMVEISDDHELCGDADETVDADVEAAPNRGVDEPNDPKLRDP
jgi:hypothetical protein